MTTVIKVEPGDFKGDYLVLDRGTKITDHWEKQSYPANKAPFELKTQYGVFHIRGGYGRSTFYFEVDRNGEIIANSISRPAAAIIDPAKPSTLVLQTGKITIFPNGYCGKYLPNLISQPLDRWTVAVSGRMEFATIYDMAFTAWNGSSRGACSVIATLREDGSVYSLTPESAVGSLNALTLRLSELALIPSGNDISISGYDNPFTAPATPLTSVNVTVIRGLDTEVSFHGPTHKAVLVMKPLESIAP